MRIAGTLLFNSEYCAHGVVIRYAAQCEIVLQDSGGNYIRRHCLGTENIVDSGAARG